MTEGAKPKQLASLVFILAIAVVFTLQFGPGSRGCEANSRHPQTESAATVNGREIPMGDFLHAYNNRLNQLRMQNIPETLARQIGVPKQVMDSLVNSELLAQAADKHGISVSDDEVTNILMKNPEFQKDGVFDQKTYEDIVRDYLRKTPADYEAELRRELATKKLLDIVQGSAVVSDEEIRTRFEKEGNKAQVMFVRFLPSMFADKVQLKPADVAAYQKDHAKEIADYFEKNKFMYHQSEQVHARHILIKVDKDATEAQKKDAKERAEKIRKDIVDNKKDFAEEAKAFSEDPGSKDSGGDLGFNESSSWVPEFSDAAFKLKPGEVSQVVETPFGFHIIKVEEKRPPQNKELKDVEGDIAKTLLTKEKSQQLAKAAADTALADIKAGKKLVELFPPPAKDKESNPWETPTTPEATDSGEFDQTQLSLPKLGAAPELVNDVFKMDAPGPMQKVYSANDGYVVADVIERVKPSDEKFAAEREKLRDEAIRAKQIELEESYLKALRKQAQIVTNDKAISGQGPG